ncbi:MAG: GNAT family N-acetyltransferase [Pseudobdellovibrionaceae bacterium]
MTSPKASPIPPPRFDLVEVKSEKDFAAAYPVLMQLAEIETPETAEKLTLGKAWEQYQSSRKQGFKLYAAQTSLEIIGTIALRICDDPLNDGKPYAIINNLIIEEDFRGLGIGPDMLARTELLAKKEGCTASLLAVLKGNKKVKSLYEENGYSAISDLMIKEI